ncbi:hypothetical protein TELCIR_16004, partial [Teladorsagia circumcincta]
MLGQTKVDVNGMCLNPAITYVLMIEQRQLGLYVVGYKEAQDENLRKFVPQHRVLARLATYQNRVDEQHRWNPIIESYQLDRVDEWYLSRYEMHEELFTYRFGYLKLAPMTQTETQTTTERGRIVDLPEGVHIVLRKDTYRQRYKTSIIVGNVVRYFDNMHIQRFRGDPDYEFPEERQLYLRCPTDLASLESDCGNDVACLYDSVMLQARLLGDEARMSYNYYLTQRIEGAARFACRAQIRVIIEWYTVISALHCTHPPINLKCLFAREPLTVYEKPRPFTQPSEASDIPMFEREPRTRPPGPKNLDACTNGISCPIKIGRQELDMVLDFSPYGAIIALLKDDAPYQ